MAFTPIALTVPQYSAGNPALPASGWVLKAYKAGTTTVLQMATDSTGLTLVNDIVLNAEGEPEVTSNVVIPHINESFKLALYPTQAAADANTGARWNPDNLTATGISASIVDTLATLPLLRAFTGTATSIILQGSVTAGDGQGALYRLVTGSPPATFVDDGAGTIVPTGGDGSSAWLSVAQIIYDSNRNEVLKFGATAAAVNELTITNAATANNPSIGGTGTDTNIGTDIVLKGTGKFNSPNIRLTDTGDVSLSSTAHAFQIGLSTGLNIGADANEIMARNNGAISVLGLNNDGGDVNMRSAAQGLTFTDTEIKVASPSADRPFTLTPKGAAGLRVNDGSSLRTFVTSPGVASAVNWLTFTNSATGNGPIIGSDGEANVDINITPNGTGKVVITAALDCGVLTSTGIDDNATIIAMTIDSAERVLINKTVNDPNVKGVELGGISGNGGVITTSDGSFPLVVNRLTDDGALTQYRQDNVTEGIVSVSGTTVTYGAFCGAHWSQLFDLSNPDIPKGTVVSTIDEMCEWYAEEWKEENENGEIIKHYENVPKTNISNPDANGDRTDRRKGTVLSEVNGVKQIREDNDQLVKFKISDVPGDKRVYGIFGNWEEDGDANIHSLGATVARVTGPCHGGDLLESAGDGTARVQTDDLIRSSTLGKVNLGFPNAAQTDENLVPVSLYPG